jgi:multiple sugar transport system substrate-binding protein
MKSRIRKSTGIVAGVLAAMVTAISPVWSQDKPYDGVEIVVADITRSTSDALKPFLSEFTEKTGIVVRFEQYASRDLLQRVLLDVEARTGNYDVMYLSPSWMGPLVEGGHLVALDDLIKSSAYDMTDFMPITMELVKYRDRPETWAMPYLLTAHVMVYRRDLFEDPTEMAAFKDKYGYDLAAPTDMAQLLDVAEFFTRDKDGDGSIDLFGMAEPQKMHFQAWDWAQALVWTHGGKTLTSELRPALNSDEAIKGFEQGKLLQQYQPEAVLGWKSENKAFFREGSVAIMRVWNEVADALNDPEKSPVAGKVGYSLFPAAAGSKMVSGKSRVGGGGLAILNTSQNQEAAFEYLKWVASPEMAKRLFKNGGSIVRVSEFESEENRQLRPWLNSLFPVVKQSILHTAKHRPSLPESFAIEEQLAQAWVSFVRGERTAKEALSLAHNNIDKLLKKAGYYK